jgi:hypothetical protein
VKTANETVTAEANTFNLFFDERLTKEQALKMITFASDSKFIDGQTKSVDVKFVTYNVIYDIFSTNRISFSWKDGGKIQYTNDHGSIATSPAPTISWILFAAVLLFLTINTVMELKDVLHAIRKFEFTSYISDGFNVIDWLHLLLMWVTLISFLDLQLNVSAFAMQPHYSVCALPCEGVQAFL